MTQKVPINFPSEESDEFGASDGELDEFDENEGIRTAGYEDDEEEELDYNKEEEEY